MYPEISAAERFPLLTAAGRKLLHAMRQHPQAPIWNWPNGEQLNARGLARVRKFAAELSSPPTISQGSPPSWLPAFVDFCLEEVPFYRRRSAPGTPLAAIPSSCREDLAPKVWDFVPDSQPLDELIVFSSTGTTGHPAQTPSDPAMAACGIPLLELALASTGVGFPRGAEQMALTNVAAYCGAYTTAIVVAYLEEAGCIRVNLSPEAWRQPGDCHAYLDRWWAAVMLGDPQAFAALTSVGIKRPPQVMVSSIMRLSDALAGQLTAHFGCPVIDVYALTEAGIVAVKTPDGHAVLPHDLYLEILDDNDVPCPPGVRGEIALTGGRNPFLPLLRYRTGDYASLGWRQGRPILIDLEGRQPVLFPVAGDRVVHSMEVTRLLRRFPLVQYQLHQDAEGGFRFRYRGGVAEDELRGALRDLLGGRPSIVIEKLSPAATPQHRKVSVYQSARRPTSSHSA
ncbi:MAG: AMP-binding protein [Planctomycetes bacterium]|nr:AMP-binding protein [Planctomycetota bacterium]